MTLCETLSLSLSLPKYLGQDHGLHIHARGPCLRTMTLSNDFVCLVCIVPCLFSVAVCAFPSSNSFF